MAETKTDTSFTSLFGKRQDAPAQNISDLSLQLNNIATRLRIIEERYAGVRDRMHVSEQNMIRENTELNKEVRVLSSELTDFGKEFEDLKVKIRIIISELKACAKKEDVDVIKKYVNLWDPIKYVTQDEIDRIVEHKIHEKLMELKHNKE